MLHAAKVAASETYHRARASSHRHRFTSFGGGVAATYVFLYLLSRLAEGNQAVAAVLGDKVHSTPLAGLATSLVALLGFVTFYALEWATTDRSAAQPSRPGRCSWFSLPSSPRTADW